MEPLYVIKENWLTQKPRGGAKAWTLFWGFVLLVTGLGFLSGYHGMDQWMSVSQENFFAQHQTWRLWTALFAHADMGHLLGNALLFIPLTYLLSAYYGPLMPLLGIASGGLINFWVVRTLPEHVSLLGISGVVYWMGAVWLTLSVLIDRRHRLRRRLAFALFLSLTLFVPESYKPEVSYLSHFYGFALGLFTAFIYYFIYRHRLMAAEVKELIEEEHELQPWELEHLFPEPLDQQSRAPGEGTFGL